MPKTSQKKLAYHKYRYANDAAFRQRALEYAKRWRQENAGEYQARLDRMKAERAQVRAMREAVKGGTVESRRRAYRAAYERRRRAAYRLANPLPVKPPRPPKVARVVLTPEQRAENARRRARERYAKDAQYRQRMIEYARQYRLSHPEWRKAQRKKRKVIRKVFILTLLDAQQGRCRLCRKKVKEYHVDHVMPLALGGTDSRMNLQILCPSCNLLKGAKHPAIVANEHGRLFL